MKKILYHIYLSSKSYLRFRLWGFIKSLWWYFADISKFKRLQRNEKFSFEQKYIYPCLEDKTSHTPVEPVYFYQNSWAAGKIFSYKPSQHVDVGSHVGFLGIVSQFVDVTFIDIRPIEVNLKGLYFKEGTILNLPFEDNSVESVSSICVVEHIGLGRYGDPLDQFGSEKSANELKRITKKGGKILFTVPVDNTNRIYFNAHRAFTRNYVLEIFSGCKLIEEKYIYGYDLTENYSPEKGFGTGLFYFEKE